MLYDIGDILESNYVDEKRVLAGYDSTKIRECINDIIIDYDRVFDRNYDALTISLLPSFFTFNLKTFKMKIASTTAMLMVYPFHLTSSSMNNILIPYTTKTGHIDFTWTKYLISMLGEVEEDAREDFKEEVLKNEKITYTKEQLEESVENTLKPFLNRYKENHLSLYKYYVNLLMKMGYLTEVIITDFPEETYLYQGRMWYKGLIEGNEFYYFAKSRNLFSLLSIFPSSEKQTEEIDITGKCYEFNR